MHERRGRGAIGGSGGGLRPRCGGPSASRTAAWIVLALAAASLAASRPAAARAGADGPAPPELWLGGAEDGVAAPLLEVDFALRVTGVVARGTAIQRFRNPTDRWLEGTYRFPLPERAAVDGLRMRTGDRVVEGEVREREEARRRFEHARAEGRRASLVEQRRPDVFTARVTNVGPGAVVEVEVDFQWTLDLDAGGFELRLPWIVAPRFTPDGAAEAAGGFDGAIAAAAPAGAPRPDVAFALDLEPGFPLAAVESPTHAIALEQIGLHRLLVTLARDAEPADRDFVLRWRPTPGDAPRAALFHEARAGADHLLLMLLPPDAPPAGRRPPREIVFVIDTSGSMGGASIAQARRALVLALRRLEPTDRFHLVAFDSETRTFGPGPVHADPPAVEDAVAWVEALEADGGTNMMPALVEALRDHGDGPALRQVVFVTDGCVGNEPELFAYLEAHLGRSRLFTVGIGTAPNGHFLEGAARFGRGSRTTIAAPGEVRERMDVLFAKLERPALTDLEILWNDAVETRPERPPDLYAGEPVLVAAKVERFVGEVLVRGRLGDAPWEARVPLVPGPAGRGLGKLFGRLEIDGLMDGLVRGEPPERVREAVVAVALEHGLVSRWTSLVAVDRTPARPASEALAGGAVATGAPADLVLPQGATPAAWLGLRALGALALAGVLHRAAGGRRPHAWRASRRPRPRP